MKTVQQRISDRLLKESDEYECDCYDDRRCNRHTLVSVAYDFRVGIYDDILCGQCDEEPSE